MKLDKRPAPHIRVQDSIATLMLDVIIVLVVLSALAFLFYGVRALEVCAYSVITSMICDALCTLVRGKKWNPRDLSPVVTGLIIALAMPATISYYVVCTAAAFAIVVVKHPFGGTGNNVFNPAAAGFSFAAICWPQQVFMYPMPFAALDAAGTFSDKLQAFVYGDTVIKLYQNPSFVLKLGGTPSNDIMEMLLGNYPGPMGATNILVLVTCLVYLLFRRTIRWQLPISFLGTCAFIAFLFPRIRTNGVNSLLYEMMSGMLLFGAVFMITDPATSPKRDSSMAFYGIFTGIITMLFRYFGGFEESMSFAVLFANVFAPVIDLNNETIHRIIRRKNLNVRKTQKAQEAKSLG